MHWHRLEKVATREKDLQAVFDNWHDTRAGRAVAGVPAWLDALGPPDKRKGHPGGGYAFTPDVLWTDARLVVELKCAAKFEPQALAEVLHHAWALEEVLKAPFRSLMVSSYNPWLRRAVDLLVARGLDPRCLIHMEADHLSLPTTERSFVWLDTPRAAWRAPDGPPPPCIPEGFAPASARWYVVNETGSWIATERPAPGRPTFMRGAYAMLTPVSREPGRYLLWTGRAPEADASRAEAEHAGLYWLWDEALPGGESSPRSPFA